MNIDETPLILLTFHRKINDNWSISIGFPIQMWPKILNICIFKNIFQNHLQQKVLDGFQCFLFIVKQRSSVFTSTWNHSIRLMHRWDIAANVSGTPFAHVFQSNGLIKKRQNYMIRWKYFGTFFLTNVTKADQTVAYNCHVG